ncbi:hypothetical protein D9M68_297530 [compost metagenome]
MPTPSLGTSRKRTSDHHAHRIPPTARPTARPRRPAAAAHPPLRRPWRAVRRRAGQGPGAADPGATAQGHRRRRRAAGRGARATPAHPHRRRLRRRRRHRQLGRRARPAHARRGVGRLPGAEPLRIRLRADPGDRRRGPRPSAAVADHRRQRHLQRRRRGGGQGGGAQGAGHRPPPARPGTAGGRRHRQPQPAGLRLPQQGAGRGRGDLLRAARPARPAARDRLVR